MIKQALIHVENTDGIIEFARFLSDSGWTLLSANKTEDLLKKEDIPVTKELSLVENNTYINDTSTLLQRILSSNYFDADSNQNNQDEIIGIICMNIVPALHSIQNEQKLKSITKPFNYSISTILRTSFMNYENLLILSDPSDYKEAMIQLRTNNITEDFFSSYKDEYNFIINHLDFSV